jgi:scyllo-inositol 2-dehydrogenase (NADP+)
MAGTVFHAPLIRALPAFELVLIAGSADSAAAIASPGIDLVVVATPNSSHYPLAAAALEAGKHVVVDKPFALSLGEADDLMAMAKALGRVLTVFHNRRWDGDFLALRRLVASGRLGAIAHFEAHWDRFRPIPKAGWREESAPGSGLLWDLGPHLIDQALVLFGSPDSVALDLAVQRSGAVADDYFELVLRYGAMRAILSASTLIGEPRPRFAAYGQDAAYISRGFDPQEERLKAGIPPNSPAFAAEHPQLRGTFGNIPIPVPAGRYLGFYEDVAEAIATGAPPPVDPADAREGLRILALARSGG